MWLDLGLGCLKRRDSSGRRGQRAGARGSDGLKTQIGFGLEDLGSILSMEVNRKGKGYKVPEKVGGWGCDPEHQWKDCFEECFTHVLESY